MHEVAIQDRYPDEWNHCYGCGRLNDQGMKISSYWVENEAICTFIPRPEQIAFPGIVSGGVIASVIDCHSLATASAAIGNSLGIAESAPLPRCVTASLKVDFLKPTPMAAEIVIHAQATEIKGRKIIIASQLLADGDLCVRGEVVAILKPDAS